ncbi:NB-ARC domain-containing protein [Tunturibacter psychrotolerans]|uniref:WD40 repeat-containing protein SMU1 n=1 Tax=Tunturiibacter psychrotolerans TaxID=3069686 RepID=A0AAU7ZPR8_9BACT
MLLFEPSRVFISYARKDGAALAQRLQSDLTKHGFDAWLDAQRIGGGAVWSMQIEREIDTRQVMIALLSPGSYSSEMCRAEQLLALDHGKRVIPVLAVTSSGRPVYLYARQYRDFTDEASYVVRLGELLADIRTGATAILPDTYRKTRVTYLTVPPRAANYLERSEALHALRDALFAEDQRQPIALTSLAGMGGIGKTVLAKALTDDEVVRRAFPDGIVWITAGKERKRDFIEEMREVARALGDDLSGYNTALACEHQYRTTIASKAALIVVDDVWSKSDIEPLLAESPRSRFLFTTRDAAIGRFVGAHEHRANLLDVSQSRELLASWANLPLAELPPAADDMIAECGRLPLALSVVGAMLRGANAEFWTDTLDLLRKADLSAIQEQLPEGQQSFFKAVEVSFQSLKPEMQERYKALAVLLEDMAAPLPILETLWNVDRPEARRVSRKLVDRSLTQSDGADESIRLHDLQLDYVRAQHSDKEALELIRGAVRLSSNVIARDPSQFTSQMLGRLLPHRDMPTIEEFTRRVAEGMRTPWLRPLTPALHPPGTALLRTLSGHLGWVSDVALNGDGRRAISASGDYTLKVWDVESGQQLRTLIGHSGWVNEVALSRDGRRAVSASHDRTLKVWGVESGQEQRTLTGHSDAVLAVALSGDGRRAVSASHDRTLKVWDVESGQELRTLTGHSDAVLAVALSGDGRRAVSASHDRTLKVWDVESGQELRTLIGHFGEVRNVALSGDGRHAVSASDDKTLKVWDVESGQQLRTLAGHSGEVNDVALSGDGRRAVSASNDKTLKVWDIESGHERRTLTGHSGEVRNVALSGDGRRAISASGDYTLKVWDVESAQERHTLTGHSGEVNGVALSGDGRRVVSASHDRTLKVWDVENGKELRTLTGHEGWVLAVALSGDGRHAVSASDDKTLKVWDVESGQQLRTLAGHSGEVNGVALSEDGRRAVSASHDYTLKVWDVGSGQELRTLAGHSGWVSGVVLSRDGRRAVSASYDCTLKVWDVESGQELRTLSGHFGWVRNVTLSEDGRRAVSASDDKTLKVWDVESGQELRTLTGHSDTVRNVALNGDGRRAVSASYDCTLKVWDVESGQELRTLTGHSGEVRNVALSADGRRAVSASGDRTLKVWDVESGECIATFTCDSRAPCCAFADYRTIIAGDAGGRLHFLSLEFASLDNSY